MGIAMLGVVGRKSITIDEIVMIPSAYYHVAKGNFDLVRDHPPLVKIIAALPLLPLNLRTIEPSEVDAPLRSPGYIWAHYARFWEDNRAEFLRISFWARIPPILLTLALGILIFAFTRDLFGSKAALFALALFSLEPTVLAHGRVVQTDIPAAFGYVSVFYALLHYLRRPTAGHAMLVGAAGAVACLAKFAMLLVIPILVATFLALVVAAPRLELRRSVVWGHSGLALLVALIVVQAAYGFYSRSIGDIDEKWILDSFPENAALVRAAVHVLSYILPTDLVLGVFWQLWHNQVGHQGYLLGMYSPIGWWHYFPVAYALKTPIPFLVLSLAAVGWCIVSAVIYRNRKCMFALFALLPFVAVALASRINIGIRHFLPAYAVLFVISGAALDRLMTRLRSRYVAVSVASVVFLWMAVEAFRAYPDHIPYMNEIASGRPPWELLSDSNIEWGDDVRDLATFLHARGETRVRSAVLAGYMLLRYYGIENVDLIHPEQAPTTRTRYTAIGVAFLNGSTVPGKIHGRLIPEDERVNLFAAYRTRRPEVVIGKSIYVYREAE